MRILSVGLLLIASCFSSPNHAADAPLVSEFSGSELVGVYSADFARVLYVPDANEGTAPIAAEGQLNSRIYRHPEEKSDFEVFKSFERELQAAGFDLVTVMQPQQYANPYYVRTVLRPMNNARGNNLIGRAYKVGGKKSISSWVLSVGSNPAYYMVARKTVERTDVLVAVTVSERRLYAIDQLVSAAMETGTVTLSLDALSKQLEAEGRVALYGILFNTGSTEILGESKEALAIIVSYLTDNPEQTFHVVGHTDSEGDYAQNMSLSKARAEAVRQALIAALPEAESRLYAAGVGSLSPVATNSGPAGRKLNRRVELVSGLR